MHPAAALYRDLVLEHQRRPRRYGALETPTHAADGVNPLCGDRLRIELRCAGSHIEAFAFRADACAIATAAASMLGDIAIGCDAPMIDDLRAGFERLVGGDVGHDPALGDLNAFAALARYPSRRKCALLASTTLAAAFAGKIEATTENA